MPIPSITNSRFPSNVVAEAASVDYNYPYVNPQIYPTKDIWKALWLLVSTDIQAGNTFTVGTTAYTVFGLTFTLAGRSTGLASATTYNVTQTAPTGNYTASATPANAPTGNSTINNGQTGTMKAGSFGFLTFKLSNSNVSSDMLTGFSFDFPNYVLPGGSTGVVGTAPAGGTYIAALV